MPTRDIEELVALVDPVPHVALKSAVPWATLVAPAKKEIRPVEKFDCTATSAGVLLTTTPALLLAVAEAPPLPLSSLLPNNLT
jgi:hypothetical protein